jgi:hypothetical protein
LGVKVTNLAKLAGVHRNTLHNSSPERLQGKMREIAILMLRPFWIAPAKSRSNISRELAKDVAGYDLIFFLTRLLSCHCCTIQSAVE